MVDIESHRVVDMIPSREGEYVIRWLKTYPNISVVSRDGSTTYHNAIDEALPEAVQVSDRFHLIKNLIDYSKDYLKKALGNKVKITSVVPEGKEVSGPLSQAERNRRLTQKGKYERVKELAGEGYGKVAICKELNMSTRTYDKLVSATPAELEKEFKDKRTVRHEENTKRKQRLVDEARELKKHGFSDLEISRRMGIQYKTVRRYLDPEYNPVHASRGVKKGTPLTPFLQEVDNMLSQGFKAAVIDSAIRGKGYSGSLSAVKYYMTKWKRQKKYDFDEKGLQREAVEIIERKNLFKLLYSPLEEVKAITKAQFETVLDNYPEYANVHSIVWDFKGLLKSKDEKALRTWIEKAGNLNIAEINSFITGLKQDEAAAINAVMLPYSNGLAEGSVNKIKVIKRIMYGRCGFETLRAKILQLEKLKDCIM